MIEYGGYTGIFEFDPSIDAFHGRVVGLQDVVTFEGTSIEELRREMKESIEDYLALCEEVGKDPERPYRGEFLVRTTPDVHRAVATAAEAEGVSLNAWVETAITSVVEDRGDGPARPSRPKRKASAKTSGKRRQPTR